MVWASSCFSFRMFQNILLSHQKANCILLSRIYLTIADMNEWKVVLMTSVSKFMTLTTENYILPFVFNVLVFHKISPLQLDRGG